MADEMVRRIFHYLNRYFMAPAFRLGLGPLLTNPFSGYIMVLKTTGRKSGKRRYTPLNYAIWQGCVYCMAGFGQVSDWLKNVQSNPQVELILPGGGLSGTASLVGDAQVHLDVSRQILKNGGFAGFFMGFNPRTAPDALVAERMQDIPLVCIRPQGPGNGAADPGEWGWVSANLALILLILTVVLLIVRRG
jgi:deazaflavin-dependent oxidoreductase (nitroreductase family)